jgi:AraC-like DNA-binding protein
VHGGDYNTKKDSFYLNKMASLTKTTDNYTEYSLFPEYGRGKVVVFNAVPGLLLTYNKWSSMNLRVFNREPEYQDFSEPLLKIGYGLSGRFYVKSSDGRSCISGKDRAAYYHGEGNIALTEFTDPFNEMFSLLGYSRAIAATLTQVFQVDKDKVTRFFHLLDSEKEIAVITFDATVRSLIKTLFDTMNRQNYEKLRLMAVELLIHEINHYEENRNRRGAYFRRSTIEKVMKVERYIKDNLDEKLNLQHLCDTFDLSPDSLKACFKELYSTGVYSFIKKARLERGKELLERSDKTILDIALDCGYGNHHSFTKAFKQEYSVPPRDMRKILQ